VFVNIYEHPVGEQQRDARTEAAQIIGVNHAYVSEAKEGPIGSSYSAAGRNNPLTFRAITVFTRPFLFTR